MEPGIPASDEPDGHPATSAIIDKDENTPPPALGRLVVVGLAAWSAIGLLAWLFWS